MNSNYEGLNSEGASQVLEHLRARVREFGFGALDAQIGELLMENDFESSFEMLERYSSLLHLYLTVFEPRSVQSSQDSLERFLGEQKWSWQLLAGGDPEIRRRSNSINSIIVENMADYCSIGTLREELVQVMRDLGIELPAYNGEDPPAGPRGERP